MAWCPKCRNEYVAGITKCADCGVDLVDVLPDEEDPGAPVVLWHTDDPEKGSKIVTYLQYKNVQTAGVLMTGETEDEGYDVVVAGFEKEAADAVLQELEAENDGSGMELTDLLPEVEEKLDELKEEEANQMFSDLRTETSTVYVKKKDKYNDLKFSGLAFIIFGVIGGALVIANLTGMMKFFTTFSSAVMGIVFIIFLAVGITSLIRAKKLKSMVREEEKVTNEVLDWIESEITDEHIASLIDESLPEEDNYFSVHSTLCDELSAQFAFLNKEYVDQLMDDRYNDYCEKQ